jgi:tetratricopeptide (TPR) repeat protein
MEERMIRVVLLVAFWEVVAPFLTPATRDARRGRDRYEAGDYPEAASRLEAARRESPDPRLDFNLGAARYRNGEFEAAGREFQAARRGEALPEGDAAYNLGNARFQAGDLEGALQAYRDALGADPADEDARFNYEWTKKVLAQALEQPGGLEETDPDQRPEEDGEQDSRGSRGEEQKPDSTASPPEPQEQEQGGQQEQQNAQARPGEEGTPPEQAAPGQLLSRDEAARLLDAITPEERELIAARLKAARRQKVEKDW